MGLQYEMLEHLIKDTKKGKEINDSGDKKYIINNPKDEPYYWKSRAAKDQVGNNTCHFVFEISNLEERYKYLKLLLDEEVGDIRKFNVLGLIPNMIEHRQPIPDMPDSIVAMIPTTK